MRNIRHLLFSTEPRFQWMLVRVGLAAGFLLVSMQLALTLKLDPGYSVAILALASVPAIGLLFIETLSTRERSSQGEPRVGMTEQIPASTYQFGESAAFANAVMQTLGENISISVSEAVETAVMNSVPRAVSEAVTNSVSKAVNEALVVSLPKALHAVLAAPVYRGTAGSLPSSGPWVVLEDQQLLPVLPTIDLASSRNYFQLRLPKRSSIHDEASFAILGAAWLAYKRATAASLSSEPITRSPLSRAYTGYFLRDDPSHFVYEEPNEFRHFLRFVLNYTLEELKRAK